MFHGKLRHSEDAFAENNGMAKPDIRQVFGRNLEAVMQRRGVNQERLAKLSGLSAGHISEARRGISAIGITALAALAEALDVMPFELLVDSEEIRRNAVERVLAAPSGGAANDNIHPMAASRRKKRRKSP